MDAGKIGEGSFESASKHTIEPGPHCGSGFNRMLDCREHRGRLRELGDCGRHVLIWFRAAIKERLQASSRDEGAPADLDTSQPTILDKLVDSRSAKTGFSADLFDRVRELRRFLHVMSP